MQATIAVPNICHTEAMRCVIQAWGPALVVAAAPLLNFTVTALSYAVAKICSVAGRIRIVDAVVAPAFAASAVAYIPTHAIYTCW